MLSKQQQGKPIATHTEAVDQHPPVPADYGPTVSSVSLVVSLLAAILSAFSLYRSSKLEKSARFEAAYGAPLRLQLRSFEKLVIKLRAFVFPAGNSVPELKEQIEENRVDLEVASLELSALLREIDASKIVSRNDWNITFQGLVGQAEALVQASSHHAIDTEIKFRSKVEEAQKKYEEAISSVRVILDEYRSKL